MILNLNIYNIVINLQHKHNNRTKLIFVFFFDAVWSDEIEMHLYLEHLSELVNLEIINRGK